MQMHPEPPVVLLLAEVLYSAEVAWRIAAIVPISAALDYA